MALFEQKSPAILGSLPTWLSKKILRLVIAAAFLLSSLFFTSTAFSSFSGFHPSVRLSEVSAATFSNFEKLFTVHQGPSLPLDPNLTRPSNAEEKQTCAAREQVVARGIWTESQTKYSDLMDDKFTIVVQTYERPEELNKTLQILTDTKIPSLYEIVVVWNNVGTGPPEDYVTAHNVGVRYRASERNSLNEKLRPDPGYNTQAVLLSDDDVYYEPPDLDFVFQTWRKYGRNRITGAFARCVVANPDGGGYWYDFCRSQPHYSLVLTGLAFIHVSFLDYYHSDDALMTKIRDHVEKVFNCEDIALNFIAAMLTCEGPLQITGAKPAVNRDPPVGLSRNAPHMSVRLECINLFPSMFGYMPLFNTTERIVLGVLPTG